MKQKWIVVYKTVGDNDDIVVEIIEADAQQADKIARNLRSMQDNDLIDLASIQSVKDAERLTYNGLLRTLDGIRRDA